MDLSKVKTSELVAELETREGVNMIIADPYQKGEVSVEGPAVILVIMMMNYLFATEGDLGHD